MSKKLKTILIIGGTGIIAGLAAGGIFYGKNGLIPGAVIGLIASSYYILGEFFLFNQNAENREALFSTWLTRTAFYSVLIGFLLGVSFYGDLILGNENGHETLRLILWIKSKGLFIIPIFSVIISGLLQGLFVLYEEKSGTT